MKTLKGGCPWGPVASYGATQIDPNSLANHAITLILRYDTTRIAPYIAEKGTFSANAN
jgi:hypothetical protein